MAFQQGIARLLSSRLTTRNLVIAVLRYRGRPERTEGEHPYADVVAAIDEITYSQFDAFEYITNVSDLIYATTLLDTFLSDTTKFLLLLYPGAIGRNSTVTLQALLESKSKSQLITDAATKKARELGHLPFVGRLEFLEKNFGLLLQLPQHVRSALEHYSGIRNVAVHDQGLHDIRLVDDLVTAESKTCPRHPTPVNDSDVTRALDAYEVTAFVVARAILEQVFGNLEALGVELLAMLKETINTRAAKLIGT